MAESTTDIPTQGSKLAEPFPVEQLKRHPSKGLTYVPIPEVVARLNRVLGHGNWATRLVDHWTAGNVETSTGDYPKWVMAHVELSGTVDGQFFSYSGVGGQEVQFFSGNPSKGPVDIGDNYKGAMSDAIKKAAQSLGVGLDLAREDDAMDYERALAQADEPKASSQTLDLIADWVKHQSEADKSKFKTFWANLTGDGRVGKKFNSGQVTVAEADEAIKELGLDLHSDDDDESDDDE